MGIPVIVIYMSPCVILSLIGAGFIIVSFATFKSYRHKSPLHSNICCMAICDWFMSLMWWLPLILPPNKITCLLQAYSIEFFAQGTMVWTSIFAIRLFLTNTFERTMRHDVAVSHVIGWGIPFLLTVFASGFHLFGHAGAWCWIDDSHPYEQIFMGDGLAVVMFLIELVVFTSLIYQFREAPAMSSSAVLRNNKWAVVVRFGLFLIIPPLCWGFGLANRLMTFIRGEKVYWLQVLQAIFTTSQGFLNALIYGWDPELQALWSNVLCKKQKLAEKNPLLGDMGAFPPAPISGDAKTVQVNVNALYAESDYDSAESRDYSMQ